MEKWLKVPTRGKEGLSNGISGYRYSIFGSEKNPDKTGNFRFLPIKKNKRNGDFFSEKRPIYTKISQSERNNG